MRPKRMGQEFMVKIVIGEHIFRMTVASAKALRASLDTEIAMQEQKFNDRIAAMLQREPRRPWQVSDGWKNGPPMGPDGNPL